MGFSLPFSFALPTVIEYGEGAAKKIPEYVRRIGARTILVVTDPGLASLQWFRGMTGDLEQAGFRLKVFSDVEANPKDRDVSAAAKAARDFQADCLLAVGGGSPMDCAKVASILAVQGGKPRDYEDKTLIGEKVLPLIAVPTTAGTGSEVTFGAVITDTDAKFKFTVKSPRIAPRYAVADPLLTVSMPASLTAATGMDALTHAIEAFTSSAAEPIADACALYAAGLIAEYLPRAVKDGNDIEARSALLLGSLIAGIAFSHSDVGAVHCIAEALGGVYDIPHGVGNAVCLPEVMSYCQTASAARYAKLGAAMGVRAGNGSRSPGAEDAVTFVRDLARAVGLPAFRSFNIPESEFASIAGKSAANGSNKDNVPVLAESDYLKILRTLDAGKS